MRADIIQVVHYDNYGERMPLNTQLSKQSEARKKVPAEIVDFLKDLTDPKLKMLAVAQNPFMIKHLTDPDDETKMAAVLIAGLHFPEIIGQIKKADYELRMIAIQLNSHALKYIKAVNQTHDMHFVAVHQDHTSFHWAKKPEEDIQLLAVSRDGRIIRYIRKQSQDVQLAAVRQNGRAIKHIINPSESVCQTAVRQDGWAITTINNPSEDVQIIAVKSVGDIITKIKNPSVKVLLVAADKSAVATGRVKNLPEVVQIHMIKNKATNIRYIKKPTLNVQRLAFTNLEAKLKIKALKNPGKFHMRELIRDHPDEVEHIKLGMEMGLFDENEDDDDAFFQDGDSMTMIGQDRIV